MNRRTFIKYLSCTPIALAALLTKPLATSVVQSKEKPEELAQEEEKATEGALGCLEGNRYWAFCSSSGEWKVISCA